MDDQRAHIADVRDMTVQIECFDEPLAGIDATVDLEGKDSTGSLRRILAAELVPRAARQARIVHRDDLRMQLKPFGDLLRILDMTIDAQRQRLDALSDEERIERRDRGAEIAQ